MAAISLKIVSGPNYSRDDDGWEHNAYTLELLSKGDQSMTIPWRQGMGITHEPELSDVLEALLSDAAGYDNAQDFEDWASEYGYDTDSRKAEKVYKSVGEQTEQLRDLLGIYYESSVFPSGDDDTETVARRLAGSSAEVDC